jgi:hypothetical protein
MSWTDSFHMLDILTWIILFAFAYFIWWMNSQRFTPTIREVEYKSRRITITSFHDLRGKKKFKIVVNGRLPADEAPTLKLAEERGRAIIDKL